MNFSLLFKTLLSRTQEALSFIVFVPMSDNLKILIEKTKSSEFCKNYFILSENSVELNRFSDYKATHGYVKSCFC
jgi:hypothetical protein